MTPISEKEKLASIFKEVPIPTGLEQRVLFAVKTERHREEIVSRRSWTIGTVGSILAVFVGLAASWQSFNTSGVFEILQTAVINLNTLRPIDLFWGIMENLPLNSLALTFCAATALGWLASLKKQERQHFLHLKFNFN
jgi:hypothetical protein